MHVFNVFNGEYPFDQHLGCVSAETAEEALVIALKQYGNHCVVEPMEIPTEVH
jgi:hypothetical protein